MKDWEVTAELDMCADRIEKIRVRANTARNAEMFSVLKFKNEGHFAVWIQSVKEVQSKEE